MLRLGHLNVPVADLDRATAFYARWFGFDRTVAEYADRTRMLNDASGFDLALHEGAPAAGEKDWHFGFLAPDAASVRDLLAAMAGADVVVTDEEDTAQYVGFKCRDPDGNIIEIAYEPRPAA
jgi:catechol 2,3-dioxygenase-like lactoylglutathione lyase family enzyme